jgi:hypothetical protein
VFLTETQMARQKEILMAFDGAEEGDRDSWPVMF